MTILIVFFLPDLLRGRLLLQLEERPADSRRWLRPLGEYLPPFDWFGLDRFVSGPVNVHVRKHGYKYRTSRQQLPGMATWLPLLVHTQLLQLQCLWPWHWSRLSFSRTSVLSFPSCKTVFFSTYSPSATSLGTTWTATGTRPSTHSTTPCARQTRRDFHSDVTVTVHINETN